jgi:EAL domain-containing protein (putative c-di-GMP-specific phosphodiesterase class I)
VQAALRRHGVDASQLVCEITESVAMEDTPTTQRVIEQLTALGLKLSIDDFGTGYSSLAALRQLRPHELKIDRSFVVDVAANADARAVVDAIVGLAHALGVRVVAEGVETAVQHEALVALGCDALQGFHFGRPVPAPDFPACAAAATSPA